MGKRQAHGIVSRMGVRSGDKVEWTGLSPYSQLNNEIWVNI